jgi:hypothetical protein
MAKVTRGKSSRIKPRVLRFTLAILLIGLLYSLAAAPAYAAAGSDYAGCPELHLHSTGMCVKLVQTQLDLDQVGPYLRVDGVYLSQTRLAVENFQRAMGIQVDGTVGPQTYNALFQYESDAGIPTPGTSGFGHFARSAWDTVCGYARIPYVIVPVIGGVVTLIALWLALRHARRPDVKSMHLEVGRRGVKAYTETHTPQRIVDSQSDALKHIYGSRPLNELPAPDNTIRSIEGGIL